MIEQVSATQKTENVFKITYLVKKRKKKASFQIFVEKNEPTTFLVRMKIKGRDMQGTFDLLDDKTKEYLWGEIVSLSLDNISDYGNIEDIWEALKRGYEIIADGDVEIADEKDEKKEGAEDLNNEEIIKKVSDELINTYHIKTASDTKEIYIFEDNYYKKPDFMIEKYIADYLATYRETFHPRIIREIIELIKAKTMIPRADFNSNHDYIPCKNGYLEIKTGVLKAPDSKLVYTWQLPVNFDQKANCPTAEKILNDVLGKDYVETFWEFAGYCLYNKTIKKSSLVLYGTHNTGKTTVSNIIKWFLGKENIVSNELKKIAEDRWAPATLFGKLCNIANDISGKDVKDDSIFKAITDGNEIMAEIKGVQPFSFTPICKLMFTCNKLPRVTSATSAFYERLNLIECTNEFSGDIPGFKDGDWVTEEERSGMLNHALAGLGRIRKNKKFSYTKSWTETEDEYNKQSDSVEYYIQKCTEVDISSDVSISTKTIYDNYKIFCEKNSIKPINYMQFVSPNGTWKKNFGSQEFSKITHGVSRTFHLKLLFKEEQEKKVSTVHAIPTTSTTTIPLFEDDDVSDDDWLSKFSDDFLQEQYMLSQMDPEEYREYMETKKIIERNGA